MRRKNITGTIWLVGILGALAVIAMFANLLLDQNASSKEPEGSAASSSATANPSGGATGSYPNGTAGLGEPYIFGSPDAARILTIWEDMECPACAAFEYDVQDVLGDALGSGEVAIEYFIAPTERDGSVLSALALACAADQNKFKDLHLTLYANQFPEDNAGFTSAMITEMAELIDMPDLPEFQECLSSEKYIDYVASVVDRGIREQISGTPFILLNGQEISLPQLGWEGFISELGLDPKNYPYTSGEE